MRENWRILDGGKRRISPPADLPAIWQPYRHRHFWHRLSRISWAEARLMVLGGVFLGVCVAAGSSAWLEWRSAPHSAPDRIQESSQRKGPPLPGPGLLGSREKTQPIGDDPPENFIDGPRPGATAAVDARSGPVRVIDGDTFDIGGQRIRIAGIDAPETHPARCAEEADRGARATQRLRQLLGGGQVRLHSVGRDEDSYGRKLRDVTSNGVSVGDQLIAEGLARPYGSGRRSWCA